MSLVKVSACSHAECRIALTSAYRAVVKLARRKDLSSVSVVDFDLERLCCAYGHDQRVVLQFDNTSSRYSIRFPVGSDQRQPLHRNVESELEADFNRELALSSMSRACDRFMKVSTTAPHSRLGQADLERLVSHSISRPALLVCKLYLT